MRISELNEWIEFRQVPTLTQHRNGDLLGTEAPYYSCWAKVIPMTGTQRMMAEQIQNTTGYNIETRYYETLENTQNFVVVWRNKRLKISGAPANENSKFRKLIFRAFEES